LGRRQHWGFGVLTLEDLRAALPADDSMSLSVKLV
jgi:hypothetical protein